ncbi:MAG: copper chaperone PCu(A)C [Streptosporangiaceae bacterium]|nr:copper chaperone PCu(A)C [Streptosporangiaceae bacterium]MBV9852947.1 copper chaperone PCu(A)C [Streptosporangiaceae bacterium]
MHSAWPFRLGTRRSLMPALVIAGAAVAAAPAISGCAARDGASSVAATSAYVPQPTTPGTTVAYLVIRNNGNADRLVSVHTSVGGTVVFRAPAREGVQQLGMHTVPDIPIPAHSTVQLIPDSFHLLITGAGPMHDGKAIMLRLTFARAGTITILAVVTNPESGGGSYFLN